MDKEFELFDLEVEVVGDKSTFICSHAPGANFKVIGENLIFDDVNTFSMYALAALLPLLPAKQRPLDENDWMIREELIACPDSNCGAKFRVRRIGKSKYKLAEVTKLDEDAKQL